MSRVPWDTRDEIAGSQSVSRKGDGSECHYSIASADGSPLRPLLSSPLLFSSLLFSFPFLSLSLSLFSFFSSLLLFFLALLSERGFFARDTRRSRDYIVKCWRRRFASTGKWKRAAARFPREVGSGERVERKIEIPEGPINSRRYRCVIFSPSREKRGRKEKKKEERGNEKDTRCSSWLAREKGFFFTLQAGWTKVRLQ